MIYPFWCCEITTKILQKLFRTWWRIFNEFLSTCAVAFRTTHGKNNALKCDTEDFVPVAGLNYVVGSPSLFIRYLIGRNRNIQYDVYINAKWIYASETLACTIRDCAIIRNVIHVTLTCPFIYLCSRDANFKWTPRVWNYSLNSVRVNFVHASAEILSKCYHPYTSIFTGLDWNLSSLSITSSVVIFFIP